MNSVLDKSNKKLVPTLVWNNTLRSDRGSDVTPKEFQAVFCNSPLHRSGVCNVNINNNNSVIGREVANDCRDILINSEARVLEITPNNNICSSSGFSSATKKPKIPDGGWGWVVVFSSFIISMIADGISFSFGLLYIEFLNYFEESKSKTSWIGSLFMSVPLLSGPIMSALVDRYGCRKMTMLGGLISSIGFVLSSFGNSIEFEFVFFGFISGLGLGLCYVTAVVSVAHWFDKYRSLAVGLGACGTGVGTFVYAPLTQFLIQEFGWRGTVLLLAGTFLNVCVCGAMMRDPKWLRLEEVKQSRLKPSQNGSLIESSSFVEGFLRKENQQNVLKKKESPKYILTKLETTLEKTAKSVENNEKERGLASVKSLVSLPTFMKQNEKVPLELLEPLGNNKTVFNVILENYPFLLHCRSVSNGEKLNQFTKEIKSIPVIMSMKLQHSTKKDKEIKGMVKYSSPELAVVDELVEKDLTHAMTISQENKTAAEKKSVACRDSGQHFYLRDIRLHRGSVMYRGAMLNIPRYRLRASSCPNIFRNSTTTIAKENEEKWYADVLELFKTMLDFSMFLDLHFFLMSLATILLFTWFIVPYFYLAEHLKRHGYSEVEGSLLLSIIGVTNCLGMVGLGWAGDQPWMNVIKTYAACLFLCGLSCTFMPLLTYNYNVLAVVCALFGLFFASNYSFTPSILVLLIPLKKFTTAYGLTLLCQGIGNLLGPPTAGWIFDLTGEWDLSFYVAGACIIISGILIIFIQITKNHKLGKSDESEQKNFARPKFFQE